MNDDYITINDATLRDGNHAIKHKLSISQIKSYAAGAEAAGVDIIEVGHGNGLGGSSCQLGECDVTDKMMLAAAVSQCTQTKVGIHFIPGLGKDSDIDDALEVGVEVFRIASHCTEANTTKRYIERVKSSNKTAYGVLMMSHMAENNVLAEQALLLESYGAEGVILMDSAGYSTPCEVTSKVQVLKQCLNVPIGFHAHNNLGLSIANSLAAIDAGATIVDACSKGFGAGAGNTQLEVLVATLEKLNYSIGTCFEKIVPLIELTEESIVPSTPQLSCSHIACGLAGLFSGYTAHVERLSAEHGVNKYKLYSALAARKLVAGQEDLIIEECRKLDRELRSSPVTESDISLPALKSKKTKFAELNGEVL